ncbi:hypothetical protein F4782DRAFT_217748 [Xylaria castorea]|nr:hypothetical protein F4782DRAFT_217748 [Xylaria castorea]
MGLFLPPSTSQARTRSSTSSSHRSSYQHHGSSSPFDYQYVSPGADKRHVPDTRPASLKTLPPEEDWRSQSLSSQPVLDPFQYQTEGITPEDNDTGSDDRGDGRLVDRTLRSDDVIVVEAGSSAEQELGRSRNSSPSKRKLSGGRRRKGK